MNPYVAYKGASFVKDNWQAILVIILAILLLLLSIPILVTSSLLAIFPNAKPDFVEYYKDIEDVAGISWVDMVALDTVRRKNDFDNLTISDVRDTGIDFLIVDLFKYRWYSDPEDEDGGDWVLLSDYPVSFNNKSEIENLISDFNMSFGDDFESVFDDINSINGRKERVFDRSSRSYIKYKYEISINYKELDELTVSFDDEQKAWLDTILADNAIPMLYNERFELPDYIEVVASGMFALPAPTVRTISSPFGYRTHPVTNEYKLHAGVDFANSNCHGEPVVSVADGKVVQAYYSSIAGNNIKIEHEDSEGNVWHTRYLHLNQIEVEVGENVSQGEVIGAIGNTGRSTGSHLHFELYFNGALVDPMDYLVISHD